MQIELVRHGHDSRAAEELEPHLQDPSHRSVELTEGKATMVNGEKQWYVWRMAEENHVGIAEA
ncbi:hypothetical protein N7448_009791 [Penicillium atrosanguineum]|uniref:Uncharacterized protein n=1 Tax=Penicillium atrosanguineum TaxID=1132637 RepID=A0A9W9GLJ3_9EURO|nr:uncharacterized protein N7443_007041 [Penicillium atrosanguineum]KAJ5123694.1 hypothetical protein N7448_009791 [Penicillium atrosanguineum]KAJ5142323.1 hypothetical protein N7526_003318 [Penicillium atrosanguineum]KAJ5298921.1 hypothetical protein N7443_007041 [Penicillium atrosanguineum]KAJ5320817.1 hypothetical protein N7476_003819 [Penicillium atrosanguineum]